MPPAARRLSDIKAVAATALLLLFTASAGPSPPPLSFPSPARQSGAGVGTIDLSAIPSAAEYRTDVPKGPGFVGSDAAVLSRSLARIDQALKTTLSPDRRLARLARWVYDRLGPDRALPPQSAVDLLASRLGLAEPLPLLLFIQAPDTSRLANTVTSNLARVSDLADYTHIGGIAEYQPDTSVVVVIVLSRRHVEMTPVPRRLEAPGRVALSGRLLGGYAKPELAHTLPSGETRLEPLGQGPGFRRTIDLSEKGRHRLEIMADGAEGPTVVANFPVFVAVPVDGSVELPAATRRPQGAGQVEDRLLELINADRMKAGAGTLVLDPALSLVALRHSEDMRAHDFVAHTSPTTGSAEERLHAAGIATPLAAECVGKGYSPDEIHRGFMDSPGHRAAILLAGATHVGIGVVAAKEGDRTTYFVTELLIRRIPALPADATAAFLAALNGLRAESGAPPLAEDAELSRVADETAREYVGNDAPSEKQVMDDLKKRLTGLPFKPRTLTAVLGVVDSLEEAAKRAAADPKGGRARSLGLGLAQGTRSGLPPNSIVLVVIYVN
jgi:uncharacterized protein YkwD